MLKYIVFAILHTLSHLFKKFMNSKPDKHNVAFLKKYNVKKYCLSKNFSYKRIFLKSSIGVCAYKNPTRYGV